MGSGEFYLFSFPKCLPQIRRKGNLFCAGQYKERGIRKVLYRFRTTIAQLCYSFLVNSKSEVKTKAHLLPSRKCENEDAFRASVDISTFPPHFLFLQFHLYHVAKRKIEKKHTQHETSCTTRLSHARPLSLECTLAPRSMRPRADMHGARPQYTYTPL